MKFLLIALTLLSAPLAFADFEEGKKAVAVNFTFTRGGPGLGADFEYGYDRTYGIGGFFRMQSDDDNPGTSQDGITALGAFIRPHFNRQNWDFSLGTGLSFTSVDPAGAADSESMLGPVVMLGLLYEMSPSLALGFEQTDLYGWFGEDSMVGQLLHEMYFKVRFIF